MHKFRFYFLLFLVLLLKSCEVPDVQPFTQATTDMVSAINASLKQVTDDFSRIDTTLLNDNQKASLRKDEASLEQIKEGFGKLTLAFDNYAKALNKVVDDQKSHEKTAENVSKAIEDLATATAALGPIPAVAGVLVKPVQSITDDIIKLHTIKGLERLASPVQDSLIKHTTQILKLSLLQFARIDKDINNIIEASMPVSDTNTRHYYSASVDLRNKVVNQLELITNAQGYILFPEDKKANRLPGTLEAILKFEDKADEDSAIRKAWTRAQISPTKKTTSIQKNISSTDGKTLPNYKVLLPALQQRKTYYQQLSILPQTQYDAVQAKLLNPEKGAELMRKSANVLDAWARSHHDLRLLVVKARHITRQELIDHAKEIQKLVDDLQAATK